MNKPVVSIIVPVYNVSEYVEECLYSIKNQTYQNYEVIIIEDGSQDDSFIKCQRIAKEDERFTVYRQENKGLSEARNVGISKALGDYLMFVDSDDRISAGLLETAIPLLKQCDLVCFGVKRFYDSVVKQEKKRPFSMTGTGDRFFTSKEACIDMIELNHVLTVCWNKIYHRRLFDDLRFPVNRFHEDEFTTYKAVCSAKKICFLENCLYEYRVRDKSIMSTMELKKAYDLFEAMEEKSVYFAEDEELYCKVLEQYLSHIKYYKRVFQKENKSADFDIFCKEKYDSVLQRLMKTKRMSFWEKLKAIFWKVALFKK